MVATRVFTTQALKFGPEVLAAGEGACRVLGVTSKAIYLQANEDHVLALVGSQSPDSPLSIRLQHLGIITRAIANGNPGEFRLEHGAICFRGTAGFSIMLPSSRLWTPDIPKVNSKHVDNSLFQAIVSVISDQTSPEGAASLAPVLAHTLTTPGTGPPPLIAAPDNQPVAALIARQVMGAIRALVGDDKACACEHLVAMLGLGPGLTPSGDDFLAGLMSSLNWQSTIDPFMEQLTRRMEIEAPARTNKISAALLRYAAGGVLYAPAMDLGHALSIGNITGAAAASQKLLAIGATSGADTAAGILTGLLIARILSKNDLVEDHRR